MINSFFFIYNSRIIQEYFQVKICRKIRIFSLAKKTTFLYIKKSKECAPYLRRYNDNISLWIMYNLQPHYSYLGN